MAKDLDLTRTALDGWVHQTQADAGTGSLAALTTDEKDELARRRRENWVVKMQRDILRVQGGRAHAGHPRDTGPSRTALPGPFSSILIPINIPTFPLNNPARPSAPATPRSTPAASTPATRASAPLGGSHAPVTPRRCPRSCTLVLVAPPDFSAPGAAELAIQNAGATPTRVLGVDLAGPLAGGLREPKYLAPGAEVTVPLAWGPVKAAQPQLLVRTSEGTVILPGGKPGLPNGASSPGVGLMTPTPALGTPANPIILGALEKRLIDAEIKDRLAAIRRATCES